MDTFRYVILSPGWIHLRAFIIIFENGGNEMYTQNGEMTKKSGKFQDHRSVYHDAFCGDAI